MKIIYAVLALLVFLVCVICSYYYLFHNPFGFTSRFNDYGQYFPAFVALSGWFLFLIGRMFLFKKMAFRELAVIFILNIFMLALVFSRYYSFANEYFANTTVALLLFAMLLSAGMEVLHALLIVFAGMFFVELYLAYKQIAQIHQFSFSVTALDIQGTLQNSGIFSWYIVSQLPFLYYLFFCIPAGRIRGRQLTLPKQVMSFFKSIKVIVFAVVLALVALISWLSQSRIAMIALCILLLSFLILRYGAVVKMFICKLPKSIIGLAAGVLVAGLSYTGWYLFNLKKLSAITRLMTLDIAKDHLADQVWLGTGIGRVSWYYPQWQAYYFATHPHPPNYYFLSAGESYYLFNEYVELFCMIGLPGFIAFSFLLIWFFTTRSVKHNALLQAAKLTVITMLVCGISSYPFHVTFLLLLLVCCLAIAAIVNENKVAQFRVPRIPVQLHNTAWQVLPVIIVIIAGVAVYSAFGQWQAKKQWDKLRNRLDGTSAEINGEYGRLYKTLHCDGKFLTDYGLTLSEDSANCPKASGMLEEAKQYFISNLTIEVLAQAYKKAGDSRKAIENYEWLCHYQPNRFGTKLELLKLYVEVRDTVNARKTADLILTMPVKLPSFEVDRIKAETASIMNRSLKVF